jgi:ribonuclease J
MIEVVYDAVDGTLRSIPPARRKDPAMVEDAIRRAARSAVNEVWGKKPICKVFVHLVDGR